MWRIRYNEELNTLLNGEDIVRFIKSQRIRWLGHIERINDNAMPKRMLKGILYSRRRKGRPRMRWLDDVESDLKKMEVEGWKEKMREESSGDWLQRRPRLTQGCSADLQACTNDKEIHRETHRHARPRILQLLRVYFTAETQTGCTQTAIM
jgi:hypothetical protein